MQHHRIVLILSLIVLTAVCILNIFEHFGNIATPRPLAGWEYSTVIKALPERAKSFVLVEEPW